MTQKIRKLVGPGDMSCHFCRFVGNPESPGVGNPGLILFEFYSLVFRTVFVEMEVKNETGLPSTLTLEHKGCWTMTFRRQCVLIL